MNIDLKSRDEQEHLKRYKRKRSEDTPPNTLGEDDNPLMLHVQRASDQRVSNFPSSKSTMDPGPEETPSKTIKL